MKKQLFIIALACIGITTQAQNINGTWSGELNAGLQKIKLVLNLSDEGKCTLDSPDQGAFGIAATTNFVSSDSINVRVASLNASYAARLQNGELKGTFTQNGFKLPLSLKPSEIVELKRPQNPQPPYPYETEEVTFQNTKAGATLAGTLTIPANGSKYVLLMVTGSGAQNRDEEMFGHKPFAVLADRLARAGIATLRYDDRATGKSVGGMDPNVTTLDFAEDAKAGIEWLRSQKRFKKIGIIGHSEGGTIAFMLGAQKKVDFIVSLAGTAVKGDSVILEQNKALGGPLAAGLTMEQLYELPAIKKMVNENAWYRFFMQYNPQGDIAEIKCPVMALNGSKDLQVIACQNLSALRSTLPSNKKNLIKEYEDLNHLFQHCTTGLPNEYGQIEETISPEVLSDISSWIKQLQ
jgi:hypothetical protein